MKIMEVVPTFWPVGGGETLVYLMCCEILENHKDVDLCVVSLYDCQNTPYSNNLEARGANIHYLGKKKGIDFKCAKKLRTIIDLEKPDVCHIHLSSFLTLKLSRRCKKQKSFYTIHHSMTRTAAGRKITPNNLLRRKMIKSGNLTPVAISPIVGKTICDFFGIEKVDVVNNGIDVGKYDYSKKLSERKYDFVSVGRLVGLKNNIMMLECFAEAQKSDPDLSYLILGDGPEKERCENFVREHNLKNVHIKGYVSNVNEYLSDAKCLLIGSKFEGNPMVINEAIASGAWVIATAVGGIPDVIDDTNGFLATPDSKDDFLRNMNRFFSEETSLEKIIADNIAANREKVSMKRCASEYLSLFERYLSKK